MPTGSRGRARTSPRRTAKPATRRTSSSRATSAKDATNATKTKKPTRAKAAKKVQGARSRTPIGRRGEPAPAGPAVRLPPWRVEFRRFTREWRRKHPRRPGKVDMARTFLRITRTVDTAAALAGLGAKDVPVIIENLGNVAAYTCVVRMFEARPRSPIHEKIPLGEFKQGGQSIFTLQPGERSVVRVPFVRTMAHGTFIALVSDPLLDPNDLSVADWTHRRVLLVNLF